MLIETGRVVAVDKDGLWVETIRQSTCSSCSAQKACGHGLMNRYTSGRSSFVRVLPGESDLAQCRVDDEVRISIPEAVILKGSAMVYMLPIASMLAGALLGDTAGLGEPNLGAALGAVVGFAAGVALVSWHAWRHRDDHAIQPTLLDVVRKNAGAVELV